MKDPFLAVLEPPTSVEYLLRLYLENPIGYRDWRRLRKLQPAVYPSIYHVTKHFGRFSEFQRIASIIDPKANFAAYIGFRSKHGRWPKKKECRRLQINDALLVKRLAKSGKHEFDQIWEVAARRLGFKAERRAQKRARAI